MTGWRFDDEPLLAPRPEDHPEEVWGCEDPRLTWLPEREEWAIAYTAYSRRGPLVSLAMTRDFKEVRRLGPAMPPEDKDAALFPRRFDGRWAMIHRPTPLRGGAHMWISYSPDLRHWGDHSLVLEARDGAWWDAGKIGLGPPPLETPDGWLLCYHGVHADLRRDRSTGSGLPCSISTTRRSCCAGRTTGSSVPLAPYERGGDVDKVVFPTRLGARPGDRPALDVLRGRRQRHRPGDGEAPGPPGLPGGGAAAGAAPVDGPRRQLVGPRRRGLSGPP